jgi:predicted RecA/RadA family phage recombinase
MALQLNDLKITPRKGAYVYMPNVPQPHNCIVSSNQATALKAGDIVTVDSSVSNANCPVIKKAAANDVIFGVIPADVRKNSYIAREKVAVAVEGSYLYFIASGSIAQGAKLYFNATTGKVTSTATGGNSIVGIANTSAAGDGDFVQVKLHFETTTA